MTVMYLFAPEAERDKLPQHPKFYGERGLVGISNDLSMPALIANYRRGFYPVCHIGPMKWWCPEERAVIDPAETHVSKKVRKLLRQHKFTVSMDKDFAGVMEACAKPRPTGPGRAVAVHQAQSAESAAMTGRVEAAIAAVTNSLRVGQR